jgi:dephospho-CoA kinase
VLLVALTGGIGSGKSTVARMLAERGATVIDADDLARRAIEPGSDGMVKVGDRFGPGVVARDGSVDRSALAGVVFADDDARGDLEAIVHPEVARLFAEEVARLRDGDAVVVYEVPLLVETGIAPAFDVVVTLSATRDVRADRLRADRGMTEDSIRERMKAQASDAAREVIADEVIRNDGSLDELERQVEALWQRLRTRAT